MNQPSKYHLIAKALEEGPKELPTEEEYAAYGIRKYARVEISLRHPHHLRDYAGELRELAHRFEQLSYRTEKNPIFLMMEVQAEITRANNVVRGHTRYSRE